LGGLPDELEKVWRVQMVKKEKWVEGKGVKGRNEPASTGLVAWVVAKLNEVSVDEVARVSTKNALKLFGLKEEDGVWSVQQTEAQ
jgi:TatD DNase family protein